MSIIYYFQFIKGSESDSVNQEGKFNFSVTFSSANQYKYVVVMLFSESVDCFVCFLSCIDWSGSHSYWPLNCYISSALSFYRMHSNSQHLVITNPLSCVVHIHIVHIIITLLLNFLPHLTEISQTWKNLTKPDQI